MPARARKAAYSVPIGEPGSSRTVEWRWPDGKPVWTLAEKDGVAWVSLGCLTSEGRMAILSHFQLEERENEFPLEKLASLCPRALEREFRKSPRARQKNWPHHSDRIGAHIPATLAL